jgi:ribosomal protein L16/L10AE
MGKGSGKLATWVAEISPGVIIFEFKNLRSGRAKYFLKQVSLKIPAKTRLINLEESQIPLVINKSTFISYDSFL